MADNIQNVDELVMCLVSMGFELEDGREAIQAGKLSVQAAVDWILAGKPGATQPSRGPSLSLRSHQPSAMSEGSNPFVNPLSRPMADHDSSVTETPMEEDVDTAVVSRSQMSDEQREIKEKFEKKQREEAKKSARQEKMQARKAREQALKQIAEDRSKQKIRKPATNETPAKEASAVTSQTASTNKPTTGPPTAVLQFRLPDGCCLRNTFSADSTLEDVHRFLLEKKVDIENMILIQPFPRHEFTPEETTRSLNELRLVPNGSLVLKKVEKPTEENRGMVPGEGVGEYNFSMNKKVDWESEDPGGVTTGHGSGASADTSYSWGSGQVLGDIQQVEDPGEPMVVEDPGEEPPVPNPVFQQINQQNPFPFAQNPFQAMVQNQQDYDQGGSFYGEGYQLADNAHVHHTKTAVQLAREAVYQRVSQAPAPQDPEPSPTLCQKSHDVASLLTLCLKHVEGRLVDPRGPQLSLHGLPSDVASKLVSHLQKEKVLRPKTLQHFMPCRLRSLVLDCYAYATNELLASIRYHTNLVHLSLASCSLITDKGLAPLTALSKMKTLSLAGCKQITNKCFEVIREFAHLTTLHLEDTGVSDAGIEEYAKSNPAELHQLNLNKTAVTHQVFYYLKDLPKLQHLSLGNTKITSLTGVQRMTNLQSLNVENTSIITDSLLCLSALTSLTGLSVANTPSVEGDRALEYIAGLSLHMLQLPSRLSTTSTGLQFITGMPLQTLDLTNYINVDDSGMQYIGRIVSLRKLVLSNTRLSDEGMSHLKGLIHLQELYLDRTAITDRGALVVQGFSQLQELSLSQTSVSSVFLLEGALSRCPLMTKLNLSKTQVSTKGVLSLNLPHLSLLNLDSTRVKPHKLISLAGCPSLQKLSMRDTRPTTDSEEDS